MTNRPLITILMLAAITLTAGCQNKRRWSDDLGEPTSASELARKAARAGELTREAQRAELDGKEDRAMDLYRQAIAEYRETPAAWHNLGILLAKRQQNVSAADAFKTASELSPTDPRPVHSLGVLWEELGYLDDAARWYDDALQRDPTYQPSLRRAILVDDLRGKLTPKTSERLKVAILAEREPWWINRFKRIEQRMNDLRQPHGSSEAVIAEPPREPAMLVSPDSPAPRPVSPPPAAPKP